MYKVMLVDDELLVRIGLRSMIPWEDLGFSIVAEAGNGELAYEQYLALKPDLIITDLKMPKKDGFWLIKKIKDIDAQAEIIVLTCYDEFDFAREALKLQVSDYLLKAEMEEEEIRHAMLAKKEKLDQKHLARTETPIEEGMDREKSHHRLLALLLTPEKSFDLLCKEYKDLELHRKDRHYCFLHLDFSVSLKDFAYTKEQIGRILSISMQLIINRFSNTGILCLSKQFGKSITCFLIADCLYQHTLNRAMEDMKLLVAQYFNISFKSINSYIQNDAEKVREQSPWLLQMADRMFFFPQNVHIDPASDLFSMDTQKGIPTDTTSFSSYVASLCDFIEYNNLTKVEHVLEQMKGTCLSRCDASMNTKLLLIQCVNDIAKRCSLYLNSDSPDIMTVQKKLLDSSDMDEATEILMTFARELSLNITNAQVDNSDILIRKATDYIQQHYAKKLTLEEVANAVGISKYYFSNMFKKIQGINFSFYLNEVRIDQAKLLLMNPQATVAQVSEQVGFHDQQYFSKMFKKLVGMTVTEYRKGGGR
jgi:two-component system response regulator YesN